MGERKRRIYSIEDSKMLTRAEVCHINLGDVLPSFTAKFPWLDAAYRNGFRDDIDAAYNAPMDGVAVSGAKVATGDVITGMEDAERALYTLGLYAKLAYPGEPARQRVFGQDDWQQAKRVKEKMVAALEKAYSLAAKNPYKTDLLNKGYTQPQIDALQTLAEDIEEKMKPQNELQKERKVNTGDRIDALNKVWEKMKTISICSKVVYPDDAARQTQFLMYQPHEVPVTRVVVKVVHEKIPVAGASVSLSKAPDAARQTGKKGNVTFRSMKFKDKVTGEVSHPDFGHRSFSVEKIKKGKSNRVVVEV